MIVKHPNLYKISAKENFFDSLSTGIIEKLPSSCKLKDVTLLLPTNYACHSIKEQFIKLKIQAPNIHPISDLTNLVRPPKALLYIERMTLLNKVTKIILSMKLVNITNLASITELAEYFTNFISRAELYQIDLANILVNIDQDLALYQQELIQILQQFIQLWIKNSHLTKAGYNNYLIENLFNELGEKPLIIAGINSSVPSIIKLIQKASQLKNSQIIIYGLDEHLNENDWNNVDITHAQYNFKNLLSQLKANPTDLKPWHKDIKDSLFVSDALKPAKSCNHWHNSTYPAILNFQHFSCTDQHHEAKTIISLIQTNPEKSILIITTDDTLMVKIILHLKANNIDANIIRDYPLNKSQTAIWLTSCLNFILEKFSLLSALALLKHSFSSIDPQVLIQLELLIRDNNFRSNNIFDAPIEDNFLIKLQTAVKEFYQLNHFSNFKDILTKHLNFAQNITDQDLWQNDSGEELKNYFEQLLAHSDALGNITFNDYPQLFNHFLKSVYFREPIIINKRITLAKPLDARLHSADLIILAGLNEGIWPTKLTIDPCFNNQMLTKLGLPHFEQSIGEDAYDFQCFANANELILTRSEKIDGLVTVPSRWLLRILTLAKKSSIPNLPIEFKKQLTQDFIFPIPPLACRPTKLSVTQVEKLIFNPYHTYTDLILGLKKFPPLVKELSALDFGNFIHKALEIYSTNRVSLLSAGEQALIALRIHNNPQIKLLWWPRFERIAKWFIANENLSSDAYLENSGHMRVGTNFTITAKADRIELLANLVNIIDYKTGKLTSNKAIYTGKSLQLLLEGLIAMNGGFNCQRKSNQYQLQSLTYIQLSGGENPAEILTIDISNKPILEQTQQYLNNLVTEYQDPLTPYYYTKKKILGYCPYEHLARKFD